MKMKEKEVLLKDGEKITLKSVDQTDAKLLTEFMKKVCGETNFLAITAKEVDAEKLKQKIADCEKGKKNIMLAAYKGGAIIGYCTVCEYSELETEGHRAVLSVAVCKDLWNNGIGSALVSTVSGFAEKVGYDQIEADTVSDNVNALLLFGKFEIQPVGKFPRARKLSKNEYADYIHFVKYLNNAS